MAVTTTPRQVLTAAYSKSLKNKVGTIATESTELMQVVIRAMRGLYAFAARVNPTFFGDVATVAYSAPGWARPIEAESIFRIAITSSDAEVAPVPFDDRTAEEGMPSVFSFGQIFRQAIVGATPGPAITEDLDFYYSKRPDDPVDLDSPIDQLWNETFNELLNLEVAIYLAIKDSGSGRESELAGLKMDRDKWLSLFAAFLEHEISNERRRFGHLRRFNTNTMVPLGQLLAGGSSIQLSDTGR